MNSNIPPSPIPPWHRPVVSPLDQTLNEDSNNGAISTTVNVTYLSAAPPADPNVPYVLSLPNGNYRQQRKEIFIPSERITTAKWRVNGTFAGFLWLGFESIARSAVLEWDGNAWQLIGGNAVTETE